MHARRSQTILAPAIALLLSCSASAQKSGPTSVDTAPAPVSIAAALGTPQRQAAEAALHGLADRLSANSDANGINRVMAVDDYARLRHASLGDGFEMNIVDPVALLAGQPLDACLRGTGQWRFLVIVAGKPVGLLTVERVGNEWKMVAAGASGLAVEVAGVEARYAGETPRPRLRFIRSLQAVADFIEVTYPSPFGEPVRRSYVPLASARAALYDEQLRTDGFSAPPLPESEVGSRLIERVRLGMRDPRFMR
ncbi:hypothetical protein B0G57_11582 [Trinickia symbiotica]|uniref:Uncharacterized protein n=1 Tax=Trinickia symbiotica TaxID=863227 RepID=A0A2N7X682_9BURK|nr:hypothetical protein [Trinickia symbiotica]PMS37081.1 hypothetical protein C0Z20_10235 [Trinickia symbiotica]PPK42979.1 hypothetical protein B0G57_11582 [Trinickia symbiotica]